MGTGIINFEYIKNNLLQQIEQGSNLHESNISLDAKHLKQNQSNMALNGTTWNVQVATIYGFKINVFVDDNPARVLSSTWTLEGTVINLNDAVVTSEKSVIPTTEGAEVEGGAYGGDPDMILAAWAAPLGNFAVTISGTFEYADNTYPFKTSATAIVKGVSISATSTATVTATYNNPHYVGNLGIYNGPIYNNKTVFGFNGGPQGQKNGFNWEATVGLNDPKGYFTFVQLIEQSLVTRTNTGATLQQTLGVPNREPADVLDGEVVTVEGATFPTYFYDDDEDDEEGSFGESPAEEAGETFEMVDGPYEELTLNDDNETWPSYSRTDFFCSYLGFVATNETGEVTGYPIGIIESRWGWYATANYDAGNQQWQLDQEQHGGSQTDPIQTTSLVNNPLLLQWNSNGEDDQYNTWNDLE